LGVRPIDVRRHNRSPGRGNEAQGEAPGRASCRQFSKYPIAFPGPIDYILPRVETMLLEPQSQGAVLGCQHKGGSSMKAASKLLLCLTMVVAMVVMARAAEKQDKEKPKSVTLKGEITCTKCGLAETKKCGNCIKVKKGDKDVVYYFLDKGPKEKYHKVFCTEGKKGSVTGVVSKKDKKNFIKPDKDGVKFDD